MGESKPTGKPAEADGAEVTEVVEPAEETAPGSQRPATSPGAEPDIKWQGSAPK